MDQEALEGTAANREQNEPLFKLRFSDANEHKEMSPSGYSQSVFAKKSKASFPRSSFGSKGVRRSSEKKSLGRPSEVYTFHPPRELSAVSSFSEGLSEDYDPSNPTRANQNSPLFSPSGFVSPSIAHIICSVLLGSENRGELQRKMKTKKTNS